jgi:uncharacterized protein
VIAWKATPEGVLLPVRAKPHGGRNGVVGIRHGALLVAVTAAPEHGKANAALAVALADAFGLPRSAVRLRRGAAARDKVFLLAGLAAAQMPALLAPFAAETDPA